MSGGDHVEVRPRPARNAGRILTLTRLPARWSGKGWTVTVTDTEMALAQASGPITISSTNAARLEVRRRWFRWSLDNDRRPLVHLRGITKTEAAALSGALQRLALTPAIADAVAWYAAVTRLLGGARTEQRWIPAETVDGLLATRPEPRLLDRVRAAGCEPSLTAGQLEAAGFLRRQLGVDGRRRKRTDHGQ